MNAEIALRLASYDDVPSLDDLIRLSVRTLQAGHYTVEQIEGALQGAEGVDTSLIADGTYFVAEVQIHGVNRIVACGGWSRRKTLFGSDQRAGREDSFLDPAHEAAKIRAFFVHPDWIRRGIATKILKRCEDEAWSAGFRRLEMGATISGVPLYAARGYEEVERIEVPLANGSRLPIVRMKKTM